MCYNFCVCPLHSRITTQLLQTGWQRWMDISLWSGEFFLYLQFVSNCLQGHAVRTWTAPSLPYESHHPSSKTTVYTCLVLLPDVSTTWNLKAVIWERRKRKKSRASKAGSPFSSSSCPGHLRGQHQAVLGDLIMHHGRVCTWSDERNNATPLLPFIFQASLSAHCSEFAPRDLWLKPC